MSRLGKWALAAVTIASLSDGALAADWLSNLVNPAPEAMIDPTPAEPAELGTGWYLRGDGGVGTDNIPNFINKPNMSSWSIDLGAGYQVNNWFRVEAALDMRKVQNQAKSTSTINGAPIYCPNGLNALFNANNQVVGYVWGGSGTPTCNQVSSASAQSAALLLNAYIDLGTWKGFTPYVGAGVGVARIASSYSVNYYNASNGQLWAPTAGQWTRSPPDEPQWWNYLGNGQWQQIATPTDPITGAPVSDATPPNWNHKWSATKYNFAWNVMAGAAYAISDHAKLDVGFRYLNLGSVQFIANGPTANYTAKEVKVGLRYMLD